MKSAVVAAGAATAALLLGLATGLLGWRSSLLQERSLLTGVTSVTSVTSVKEPQITESPTTEAILLNNSSLNNTELSNTWEDSTANFSLPSNSAEDIGVVVEDFNRNSSLLSNSTEDDIDYVKMGQELLIEATSILNTGIWDFERRTEEGDAIFSRQLDNGNMVYRLTGIVDMPPQDLLVIIWDGLADYPKWNPSLLECRVLECQLQGHEVMSQVETL